MRKVKKIIILMISLFIPILVNATGENIQLTCPSSVTKGGTITCNIIGTSSNSILGLEANYSLSSDLNNFTLTSTKFDSAKSSDLIMLTANFGSQNGVSSGTILGTITVTASTVGNKTISLSNIKMPLLVNGELTPSSPSNVTATINVTEGGALSTNNNLSSLIIAGVTLIPSFSKNVVSYSGATTNSQIVISATLEDSKSSFETGYGPRTISLKKGRNEILIRVKAENGEVKEYTINIVKEESIEIEVPNTAKNKSLYVIIFIILFFICGLVLVFTNVLKKRNIKY